MSRKCGGCKKWLAAGQYECRYCKRSADDVQKDNEKIAIEKMRAYLKKEISLTQDDALKLFLVTGDSLPDEFCELALRNLEKSVFLDAMVKKGCNKLSASCLVDVVASVESKLLELESLEQDISEKENRLKGLVLKQGASSGLVNFNLKKQLEEMRPRAQELRQHLLSFVSCVTSGKIDVSSCDEQVVEALKSLGAKAEIVQDVRKEGDEVVLNLTDSGEGDEVVINRQETKKTGKLLTKVPESKINPSFLETYADLAKIEGKNVNMMALKSIEFQEGEEICGDEEKDKGPMEYRASIIFSEDHIVVEGNITPVIKVFVLFFVRFVLTIQRPVLP